MKAIPIKDAYDGVPVRAYDGTNWLIFHYNDEDRDPWKWAKFMESEDGRVYCWMSWDSDKHTVNYKECNRSEIIRPVKVRKG